MSEGEIRFGRVYEIGGFENGLCVVRMDGGRLKELLGEIGCVDGEGVSGGGLKIDGEGNVLEGKVNGGEIDVKKRYRVGRIDYLGEGNDKMEGLGGGCWKILGKDGLLGKLLVEYVKECEEKGEFVSWEVEGRIKVSARN